MTTLKNEKIYYPTDNQYTNEGGLLATLTNHQKYFEKLSGT
jgi:hypothetical protein